MADIRRDRLLDSAGNRAGRVEGFCKALRSGARFERARWGCQGFARLSNGTLDISADLKFTDGTITGSISGGTGAYEGASGSFTSTGEPATDAFHFTTRRVTAVGGSGHRAAAHCRRRLDAPPTAGRGRGHG